ncbi:hypothetical protein QQ045_014971 [Rhodiola kirilowii]
MGQLRDLSAVITSENDVGWETPEKVIIEEHDVSRSSSFSSITGKGLAVRPKSASRVTLASDESGWLSSSSTSEDSPTGDAPSKVRKSFSLSNMLDQDQSSFSRLFGQIQSGDVNLTCRVAPHQLSLNHSLKAYPTLPEESKLLWTSVTSTTMYPL